MDNSKTSIPQPASAFGYAGTLPFVIAAVVLWTRPEDGGLFGSHDNIVASMTGLAAILLSFLGGVRWGLAIQSEAGPSFPQLGISVAAAFVAWLAFFLQFIWQDQTLTATVQLSMLIIALAALLWMDLAATRRGEAPEWYPGLRVPLTVLVEISLIAALVKVAF